VAYCLFYSSGVLSSESVEEGWRCNRETEDKRGGGCGQFVALKMLIYNLDVFV
jgi:hypothetical protein